MQTLSQIFNDKVSKEDNMTTQNGKPRTIDANTVLIISQDVEMIRVWKALFEQRDCLVISETEAHNAKLTAKLLSPTLIILDLELPDDERLALCCDLRATTNGTLLLVNSSYKSVNVLEYHRAGVDETVTANISPLALLVKSLAWLARQDWIVPRRQICA